MLPHGRALLNNTIIACVLPPLVVPSSTSLSLTQRSLALSTVPQLQGYSRLTSPRSSPIPTPSTWSLTSLDETWLISTSALTLRSIATQHTRANLFSSSNSTIDRVKWFLTSRVPVTILSVPFPLNVMNYLFRFLFTQSMPRMYELPSCLLPAQSMLATFTIRYFG